MHIVTYSEYNNYLASLKVHGAGEEEPRPDGDVTGRVCFEEGVERGPHARQPLQHGGQCRLAAAQAQLQREQLATEIPAKDRGD